MILRFWVFCYYLAYFILILNKTYGIWSEIGDDFSPVCLRNLSAFGDNVIDELNHFLKTKKI